MKKILILSHTQGYSDFKIGSHHYANGLSQCGYEVYFSGIPETIFHKLLKKKKQKGTCKLNSSVVNSQIDSFFPLTLKENIFFSTINSSTFNIYKNNNKIKGVYFDLVICDFPFFTSILDKFKYKKLIYRPTDDYVAMMGGRAIAHESEICKKCDKIIATSGVVGNKIKERYSVGNDKVDIIANGYDEFFFKNINGNSSCRENAIYIGALDSRFDFAALKYLAKNREYIFFNIYGPISQEFEGCVAEFSSFKNVRFHGKVDYEETNELMNKHKVGLLLLSETLSNKGRSPMKLWEYIASGLNVLYSNIDGVDENKYIFKYSKYEEMLKFFDAAYKENNLHQDISLAEYSWHGKIKKLVQLSFN